MARSAEGSSTDTSVRSRNARTKKRASQIRADRKAIRAMNARYDAAKRSDSENRKRAAAAARSISVASDLAIRGALSTAPLPGLRDSGRGFDGNYGRGSDRGSGGSYQGEDRWGGYGYGNDYDCGYNDWYWNSCFPYWSSWCFNSCSWYFGFGWGWGFGYNWCYNPYWGWPSYYPYSSGYLFPSYAYATPSVVYNYYYAEEPVVSEIIEEPLGEVISGAEMAPTMRTPDLGLRAATEYMALGDRAFSEGRYGDAVHYYAKAIEFAPQDGVLYLVLSDALFATGDYHYAAFSLRQSLKLSPEIASLGIDKRSFYGDPADFDTQLALMEKYVADHVIDNDARLVLAANYLFSSQAQKCVEFLDSPFSTEVKESPSGLLLIAAGVEQLANNK
jgi:hypothetical protein